MQLQIFDYIDKAITIKQQEADRIEDMAIDLENFFHNIYKHNDYYLNVVKRVKSSSSLREKILRNNLYSKNATPLNLIENLSDLVGIRVECRFINDEKKAYIDLVKAFSKKRAGGYYSTPERSDIELYLFEKQPAIQKNGFEIYKVDGRYTDEYGSFCFELQIKSLVNEFWGEIDHRILYKNANYILEEDFMRDIMASIRENLSMIDHQLMTVYDRLSDNEYVEHYQEETYIESLLSKLIHDHYMKAINNELGFVMDFKDSTDLLVSYLFEKERIGKPSDEWNTGEIFMRILKRISELPSEIQSVSNELSFLRDIEYDTPFQRAVGQTLRAMMNIDFRWNLFFRILFDLEDGKNAEDFEELLIFLNKVADKNVRSVICPRRYPKELEEKIIEKMTMAIADNFREHLDIKIFTKPVLSRLINQLQIVFVDIIDEYDWNGGEKNILGLIRNFDALE